MEGKGVILASKNPNSSASILLSWELVHILVLGEDYSACLEFQILNSKRE